MHMVQAEMQWTVEMVRALPEDRNRYEVISGELIVSPGASWTHQSAVERLLVRLVTYLDDNRVGYVKTAPADIEFSTSTLVQPDLFVVPRGSGSLPRRWEDVRKLLLVVEVLSPSTARIDRFQKRELYLAQGAPEYWIVDTDAGLIEVWRVNDTRPEIVDDMIQWHPEGAAVPMQLNVLDYFREVSGES
jgi:Uma2 family endonuclease